MTEKESPMGEKKEILALYDISRIINSIPDPDELLSRVMDLVITTTRAERGFLMLRDSPAEEMSVKVARNLEQNDIQAPGEISHTTLQQVTESGQPLLTSDAKSDPRFTGSESVVLYNIRSVLCTPLKKHEQIIGLIYIDSRTSSNVFTEDDLAFLSAFANMAAIAIENARLQARLRQENLILKKEIRHQYQFDNIVGRSAKFLNALALVERVLDSSVPVLIQGESGTGKELIARAIHYNGPRRESMFLAQYCGALPETLLESELFGYRKGSFTGATASKTGLFEEADKGTFFLDEIGDISPAIQAKLLRVLQDGEMRRIGENRSIKVDVRIISATNRDLREEVRQGRFREDLYYRLNVVTIDLPSLRERRDDIPLLCRHFLEHSGQAAAKGIRDFSREALDAMGAYHWPGNIRELENAISYAVVMARSGTIGLQDLPGSVLERREPGELVMPGKTMHQLELEYILSTLKANRGDRKKTASQLGISLRTLQYKLKELKQEGHDLEN
jgi:Nif-specific regulatory protein